MPGTIDYLKRALFSRVRGLADVELVPDGKGRVAVSVRAVPDKDPDELMRAVDSALRCVGMAGIHYCVSTDRRSPLRAATPVPSGRFRLAAFGSDPTRNGIMESLTKLVPTVGRVALEEGLGEVEVLVAAPDGSASQQILEQTRTALDAVGTAGITYNVQALPADHPRPLIVRTRTGARRRYQEMLEEDEDQFSRRIQGLVTDHVERIPVVDDFSGTKVISTRGEGEAPPVSCFLPIYDRLFLLMPPEDSADVATYLDQTLGAREEDFLTYCRRGKIVPIFRFDLDRYPEGFIRRFLEDPSLPMLRSRDLDFLAARYAWNECSYLRALREDRNLSQGIFEIFLKLQDDSPGQLREQLEYASRLLEFILSCTESFEGIMWRRGHLALANFSPAMLLNRSLLSHDTDVPPALAIEVFGDAMYLAVAQAFGSSLHMTEDANPAVLSFVARLFQPSPEAFSGEYTRKLHEILSALQIAYNTTIPAAEYVDVFDSAETRRIRAIISDVLEEGYQPVKEAEVRERVQRFNDGVRRLRCRALETADIDIVGDIAKAGKVASGNVTVAAILTLMGIGLVQRAATRSFDAIVEDTALGSCLDRVRGLINRVPAHSIRLYRIRKRLGSLSEA